MEAITSYVVLRKPELASWLSEVDELDEPGASKWQKPKIAQWLEESGYAVTPTADINGPYIVSKNIHAAPDMQEEYDSITSELQKSVTEFNEILAKHKKPYGGIGPASNAYPGPGVLVGKEVRGRLVSDEPTGYIVELIDDVPQVLSLECMNSEDIPTLTGYGSLLYGVEIYCNTKGDGSLRNTLSNEEKRKLAEKIDITNLIGYFRIRGIELIFNRAPTAKRYGATQEQRNEWAVLNSALKENANAHAVLFDPGELAEDPLKYLGRENFDEMEYIRRRIKRSDCEHLGGAELADKDVWILESPLITDVDGKLEYIGTSPSSKISDRYMNMLINGLAGAESVVPGFAEKYVTNVVQADGTLLSTNERFMCELQKMMPYGASSINYSEFKNF